MTDPHSTKTTCPYCGVGCGVIAEASPDKGVRVVGDKSHPANFGRLCSKGSALAETLALDERLLRPQIDGTDVTWDAALDRVAAGFRDAIEAHGPDAVAFYVSGQLLTEDYYVANKLAKGFLGTANIDTNSRLCMASSVAGHKRAFGSDTVPGNYEDLEEADLIILVGSNLAWCHPVLYQRIEAARKKRGTRLIVIDPRKTATAETADLHLPLKPGSDVALFNGLLSFLALSNAGDSDFIAAHTGGVEGALTAAHRCGMTEAIRLTGLKAEVLNGFYNEFRHTERVVTVYSQGVNQSSAGTDKVNAIINCHLFTGRIGRRGMGPFSVTGQPNAMGGREVGGLANQLAAHMEIDNPAHREIVGRFWQAPALARKPGLKAVDLFRAVDRGEIKALWIMATNPAASLPDADMVVRALKKCPLVVVSDVTAATRTAQLADILLPAAAWGEKDGTVTNSERRISRQRAFLPPPAEARPDWWALAEVAKRLSFRGFEYGSAADIFREHAALSAFENNGSRDFDLGALATIGDEAYTDLAPVQWPLPRGEAGGTDRLFGRGGFFTPDRKARFIAVDHRPPASALTAEYPLVLNTGRVRDQWHTMTRTGLSPRLAAHIAEPFVEIHPADAAKSGLTPASLATVESPRGKIIVRTLVTDRAQKGSVFVPMHWTGPYAACAHADTLVAGHLDPQSGQPELKFTPVRVAPFAASWHGFLVSADRPDVTGFDYWALARTERGWRAEIAHGEALGEVEAATAKLLGRGGDLVTFGDASAGAYRCGSFRDGELRGALFLSRAPIAASRSWLVAQLGMAAAPGKRALLLAGLAGADQPDPGPIVCSCFQVGALQIARAVDDGAASVEAVGEVLRAGTNCGSCRAEIARLLTQSKMKEAV